MAKKAVAEGLLRLGEATLRCFVLDSGERVLSQADTFNALGLARKRRIDQCDEIPQIVAANNLKPFWQQGLPNATKSVVFTTQRGGKPAIGYPAEALSLFCSIYVEAAIEGALHESQKPAAKRAAQLQRAFAHVGLVALIDEASGYQEQREETELQRLFGFWLAAEIQNCGRQFPKALVAEIARLAGYKIDFRTMRGPRVIGKHIRNLIYREGFSEPVILEIERLNPSENGERDHYHYQRLSERGRQQLRQTIESAVACMRRFGDGQWEAFCRFWSSGRDGQHDLFADQYTQNSSEGSKEGKK